MVEVVVSRVEEDPASNTNSLQDFFHVDMEPRAVPIERKWLQSHKKFKKNLIGGQCLGFVFYLSAFILIFLTCPEICYQHFCTTPASLNKCWPGRESTLYFDAKKKHWLEILDLTGSE